MSTETDTGLFVRSTNLYTETERSESTTVSHVIETDSSIIEVTTTDKRFEERRGLRTEKLEYSRNGSEPVLLMIFNQQIDPLAGDRTGSTKDTNDIIVCAQRLGINVDKDNILVNCTKQMIFDIIQQTANSDLSKYNSLIVFFLSHGHEFDTLCVRDGTIEAHELWKPFADCQTLKNKPKMFVFQACKGDSFSTTQHAEVGATRLVPNLAFSINRNLGPDMLIAYSTIEGNVAYRHTLNGSWFIQELCKNFMAYGKRDDVVTLLIRTNKCVAGNYYYNDCYWKQMPVFMSTLRKKFYLNTNKDRDMLLKSLETIDTVLRELIEIRAMIKQ